MIKLHHTGRALQGATIIDSVSGACSDQVLLLWRGVVCEISGLDLGPQGTRRMICIIFGCFRKDRRFFKAYRRKKCRPETSVRVH